MRRTYTEVGPGTGFDAFGDRRGPGRTQAQLHTELDSRQAAATLEITTVTAEHLKATAAGIGAIARTGYEVGFFANIAATVAQVDRDVAAAAADGAVAIIADIF